jgi:hypothetical protein
MTRRLRWRVASADGARLALANPLNRVVAKVADPRIAEIQPAADGTGGTVVAKTAGRTTITLSYQRERAAGGYFDVFDDTRPVSETVKVRVTAR